MFICLGRCFKSPAKGVDIREWRDEDADALVPLANNPNVARYMRDLFPSPYTHEDARRWLNLQGEQKHLSEHIMERRLPELRDGVYLGDEPDGAPRAVREAAESVNAAYLRAVRREEASLNQYDAAITVFGALVGGIGLKFGKGAAEVHSAEIGYYVGESHWGRGIAPQAIELMCERAFHKWGVLVLHAQVHEENTRSIRALEKAGFTIAAKALVASMTKAGKTKSSTLLVRRHPALETVVTYLASHVRTVFNEAIRRIVRDDPLLAVGHDDGDDGDRHENDADDGDDERGHAADGSNVSLRQWTASDKDVVWPLVEALNATSFRPAVRQTFEDRLLPSDESTNAVPSLLKFKRVDYVIDVDEHTHGVVIVNMDDDIFSKTAAVSVHVDPHQAGSRKNAAKIASTALKKAVQLLESSSSPVARIEAWVFDDDRQQRELFEAAAFAPDARINGGGLFHGVIRDVVLWSRIVGL